MRGFFITFEGTDGCGKSTQLKLAAKRLKSLGYSVLVTKDPGGTRAGEEIRKILLFRKKGADSIDAVAEIFLYCASRRVLVTRVIEPALKKGKVVLCDRFTDSTLAYQGFGRGLPMADLRKVCAITCQGITPDLTIFLDMELEEALGRIGKADRMETAGLDFQRRVRQGFKTLARRESARIKVISGAGPQAQVFSRIRPYLVASLPPRLRKKERRSG